MRLCIRSINSWYVRKYEVLVCMQIVIFKLVFCDQKVSLIECMYFHRVLSEQIVYCLHSCDIKCLHILLLSYLESLKLIGVKLWQVSIVFLSLK